MEFDKLITKSSDIMDYNELIDLENIITRKIANIFSVEPNSIKKNLTLHYTKQWAVSNLPAYFKADFVFISHLYRKEGNMYILNIIDPNEIKTNGNNADHGNNVRKRMSEVVNPTIDVKRTISSLKKKNIPLPLWQIDKKGTVEDSRISKTKDLMEKKFIMYSKKYKQAVVIKVTTRNEKLTIDFITYFKRGTTGEIMVGNNETILVEDYCFLNV